jgi:hypothetical protein
MESANGSEWKPKERGQNNNEHWNDGTVGIIADTNINDGRSSNRESGCTEYETNGERQQPIYSRTWTTSNEGDATNSKNIGRKNALENGELERGRFRLGNQPPTWDSFPSQSPICGGNDGLPTKLDGITFSKWRNESIKAYGNAIVPQVAYEIFKAINAYEVNQRSLK